MSLAQLAGVKRDYAKDQIAMVEPGLADRQIVKVRPKWSSREATLGR